MISTQVSGKVLWILTLITIRDIEVVGVVGIKDITGRRHRFHKLECLITELNVIFVHDFGKVMPFPINQLTIVVRDDLIGHQRPIVFSAVPRIKAELCTRQIQTVIVFIHLVGVYALFGIGIPRAGSDFNVLTIRNRGDLFVLCQQGCGVVQSDVVRSIRKVSINHCKRFCVWQGESQAVNAVFCTGAGTITDGFVQIRIL